MRPMLSLLALPVVLAVVMPAPLLPIDLGTVQSAVVVEVSAGCRSVVDANGQICGTGRRYELSKEIERQHALTLVNSLTKAPRKGCASQPTHGFVFTTTKGPRAIDVSFACNTVAGRTMSRTTSTDLAALLRRFGMIEGLPTPPR
jgi:hypothetical protein